MATEQPTLDDRRQGTSFLRALPSVSALLRTEAARTLAANTGAGRLTAMARAVLHKLRGELRESFNGAASRLSGSTDRDKLLSEATSRLR